MKHCKLAFLLGLALSAAPVMHADTTYSTLSSWDGFDMVGQMGSGNTQTFGQTFVAPTDSTLQDFTFYLQPDNGTINVDAQVYAWTGSPYASYGTQGAVGSALYDSGSLAVDGSWGNFQQLTVNTGGVSLMAGNTYVILLTDVNDDGAFTVLGFVSGHPDGDGDGGLNLVASQYGAGILNGGDWGDWGDSADFGDLAYSADFSPAVTNTPEPGSLTLLGTGMLAVGGMARRRLRR